MSLVNGRICHSCGGKKGYYARTCQRCAPPRRGWLGVRGPNHPAWKGGTMIDDDGYLKRYAPDHPWPRKGGYVFEHVRLMELSIGRRICPYENVHHKDHDKTNNVLSNLELITKSEHSRLHRKEDIHLRKRDAFGKFAGGAKCPNS